MEQDKASRGCILWNPACRTDAYWKTWDKTYKRRIHANGVPSSVTINASRTNGNRAFVDNQSTFVVGEGSNLHVKTVENTGAVIGKEGNSTFKIDSYAGKDIQNYDRPW